MKLQPPAWIPNQEGFVLTGVFSSGEEVPGIVVKGVKAPGIHSVSWCDRVERSWFDLLGWKHRSL